MKDPTRLADTKGSLELAETLRAAQGRVPDDATVARLAARLGVATGSPPPTTPPSAPVTPIATAKALGVVAACGAAVAIGWLALRQPAKETIVNPVQTTRVVTATPAAVEPPPPELVPPVSVAPVASSMVRVAPAPSSAPSELELVTAAERALHENPAHALRLTEQHARLFPGGALSEEREVIAIEALVRTGAVARARSRAQAFLDAHPHSAHARRVQRAVGSSQSVADGGTQQKK